MAGRRGFSTISKERQREIASLGGKAAQKAGTGRRWTPDEAREAGRLGGLAAQRKRAEKQARRDEGG